ncbi:hypothetical protein QR680_007702 [Steinernema hermaphroditum]|uniref:non-specific serine/threonine protein kinase n=1 Tax=Steinernema hermaphroditum TaxID=289476 RepID=A0AA39IFE4_9BILA|nr:hypothetical protein QR680_007702 [Steinernema hermaphroditum]
MESVELPPTATPPSGDKTPKRQNKETVMHSGKKIKNKEKSPGNGSLKKRKRKHMTKKTQKDESLGPERQLKMGTVIRSKKREYGVFRVIGHGTFGNVYEIRDKQGKLYAMKTESVSEFPKGRLTYEIVAYELITKQKKQNPETVSHLLSMQDYGVDLSYRFVVMTYAGSNLEDLLREMDISIKTAVRLCIQSFEAIQQLHKIGFLHRDIKPANFVIGKESLDQRQLTHTPEQSCFKFVGTLTYASRAAHLSNMQGRKDDLESWFYMCLEFFDSDILPWAKECCEKKCGEMKKKLFREPLGYLREMPTCFQYFPMLINAMETDDEPKYNTFKEVLMTLALSEQVDFDEPFEWETASQNERAPSKNAKDKNDHGYVFLNALRNGDDQPKQGTPKKKQA